MTEKLLTGMKSLNSTKQYIRGIERQHSLKDQTRTKQNRTLIYIKILKISEYDQEIPQSHSQTQEAYMRITAAFFKMG